MSGAGPDPDPAGRRPRAGPPRRPADPGQRARPDGGRRGRRRRRGGRDGPHARRSTWPILDVAMPRMTGLQAARELSRRTPCPADPHAVDVRQRAVLLRGAEGRRSGYVLKSVADQDLVEACRAAMRGEPFLYPGAVTALIRDYLRARPARRAGARQHVLTPREDEVLKLIAEGHSSKEIAERPDDQRQDRRTAPGQHPGQAGHARPHRADPLRHPRRARRTMTLLDGWWCDVRAAQHPTVVRHRLRADRGPSGRRRAMCGATAPHGWVRATEAHGVECSNCHVRAYPPNDDRFRSRGSRSGRPLAQLLWVRRTGRG